MKAAPGAQLPLDEIFGRDEFISDLWRILDRNSVRMEAERRIGKTTILHKMCAEPADGWEAVYFDVEAIRSADEFAEVVCAKVLERFTYWKKQGHRLRDSLKNVRGATIGPLKFPEKLARPEGSWKALLTHAVEELVEQQKDVGKRVVFFFDELPWMVSAIANPEYGDSPSAAAALLDVLRSLRQSPTTGQGFRMVQCGSIGMHHVLDELHRHGYRNKPVNDLMLVEVPPLDAAAASDLACRLLSGEQLTADATVAGLVAERTGGFPFYIHSVVSRLTVAGSPATVAGVDAAVNWLLTTALDPCDLRHFSRRIGSYFPPTEAKIVLALLDHAAVAQVGVEMRELQNVAKSAGNVDNEVVRDVLRRLTLDHYLTRDVDGRYAFRHALVRRWWVLDRGVS